MQQYANTVQDNRGSLVSGATITISLNGTSTLASLFSDTTGLVSIANPVTTDSNGFFSFYAADGTYNGVIVKSGLATTPFTFTLNATTAFVTNAALAASSGSSLVGFLQSGTGAVARTVQDKSRERLSVYDFGVVGDSTTDDTTNLIKALAASQAQNKILNCHNATINISSSLGTYSGPGIVFDKTGSTTANPGIYATGAGYTVLTVTTVDMNDWSISVYGTANAVNGILFQNPIRGWYRSTRVYNLAGFGVKINRCYDIVMGTVSVELCGTASEYAFSMNDDTDTCNMSHFGRLQVELAPKMAIFVSGNTLSCVFDNIHSERLQNPDASIFAWSLGGGSCQYNAVRLTSLGTSANAKARLNGIDATYVALRAEGNIPVTADCSGGSMSIVCPKITGTYAEVTGQTGQVNIHGGSIAAVAGGGQTTNTHWYGGLLGSSYFGIQEGTSYTPVLTASGSAFSIGNGTAVAKYWLIGKDRVRVNGVITMGSTTTFGTGNYMVSLPFVSINDGISAFGVCFINRNAVSLSTGICRITPAVSTIDFWTGSVPATQLGATSPHTFALNDYIAFNIEYTKT